MFVYNGTPSPRSRSLSGQSVQHQLLTTLMRRHVHPGALWRLDAFQLSDRFATARSSLIARSHARIQQIIGRHDAASHAGHADGASAAASSKTAVRDHRFCHPVYRKLRLRPLCGNTTVSLPFTTGCGARWTVISNSPFTINPFRGTRIQIFHFRVIQALRTSIFAHAVQFCRQH